MVYRYAAVALLAGLGCYRAPRIPSPAVTDLGCVYDPVTEQLRVCLEPGMVGACANFGPTCRGGGPVAQADLDVPVYKQSMLYVPPAVEPVAPQASMPEVYVAPMVETDGGFVGYVGGGDLGPSVGVGGGAGAGEVVQPQPPRPTRPQPPRGYVVPPRGYQAPPSPPRPPRPPRNLVDGLQPARPLGVPPVGRPDVTAEEPGPSGPIILRRAPNGRLLVAPPAQTQQSGRPVPHGHAIPAGQAPVKRAVPRRR